MITQHAYARHSDSCVTSAITTPCPTISHETTFALSCQGKNYLDTHLRFLPSCSQVEPVLNLQLLHVKSPLPSNSSHLL